MPDPATLEDEMARGCCFALPTDKSSLILNLFFYLVSAVESVDLPVTSLGISSPRHLHSSKHADMIDPLFVPPSQRLVRLESQPLVHLLHLHLCMN